MSGISARIITSILVVSAAALFLLLSDEGVDSWSPAERVPTEINQLQTQVTYLKGFVAYNSPTPSVHAPAITELSDSTLMTVWYGGEREGSKDTALYASWLSPEEEKWSVPENILDRQQVVDDLGVHIRKLGNAVLLPGENREVWMFFVTVSIGGWSTSHINMVHSKDGGKTWGRVTRLIASPFLNISTLVKGHPFFYRDGSIGLPVYHELAGKFAELLRIEKSGKVREKVRMTFGREKIQPDIAIMNQRAMLAVLRDSSPARKLTQMRSVDGGKTWTLPIDTGLPNPSSAVSIAGDESGLVLAFNDSDEHRNPLSLAFSPDAGNNWHRFADIENSPLREDNNKDEFSYPYIILTRSGTYHLVYTWKRRKIAHVSFNKAWIKSKL